MFPFIDVFGLFQLPLYTLVFAVGFLLALLIATRISPGCGVKRVDVVYGSIYGAIGLFLGAKLVFFLTRLPKVIKNFDKFCELLTKAPGDALNYILGGLVFYGGLLGTFLGIWIYCKQFKIYMGGFADAIAPVLPLAHGFGRIGCFLGGCCYGIEYHGIFHIDYPYNELAPELSQVPRFPVQLLEAVLNFGVFFILLFLLKKTKLRDGKLLGIYLLYYVVARFFLEMLRGDVIRGGVGIFSTSQLISLLLLPVGILLIRGGKVKQYLCKFASANTEKTIP